MLAGPAPDEIVEAYANVGRAIGRGVSARPEELGRRWRNRLDSKTDGAYRRKRQLSDDM